MRKTIYFIFAGLVVTLIGNNSVIIDFGGEMAMQALGALLFGIAFLLEFHRIGPALFIRAVINYWPVVLYYGYVIFALVVFLPGGFRGIATITQYLVAGLLTGCLIPAILLNLPREREWLMNKLLILCAVLAATALIGAVLPAGFVGGIFSQKSSYRLFGVIQASGGLLEHMITLSVQLMLGVFIMIWLIEVKQYRRSAKTWLLFGLLLAGLFVTMGRSGWLGAVSGFLMGMVVTRNPIATVWSSIGMLFLTGLTYYLVYTVALNVDWIASVLRIDYGLSNREYLWGASWELIQQKPMGWGYRAPQIELAYLFSADFAPRGDIGDAGNHNTFLDVTFAYGAPAVILYYGVFLIAMLKVISSRKLDLPIRRFLFSALVGALVSSHFITFNVGGLRFTTICINFVVGMALLSSLYRGDKPPARTVRRSLPEGRILDAKPVAPASS